MSTACNYYMKNVDLFFSNLNLSMYKIGESAHF